MSLVVARDARPQRALERQLGRGRELGARRRAERAGVDADADGGQAALGLGGERGAQAVVVEPGARRTRAAGACSSGSGQQQVLGLDVGAPSSRAIVRRLGDDSRARPP